MIYWIHTSSLIRSFIFLFLLFFTAAHSALQSTDCKLVVDTTTNVFVVVSVFPDPPAYDVRVSKIYVVNFFLLLLLLFWNRLQRIVRIGVCDCGHSTSVAVAKAIFTCTKHTTHSRARSTNSRNYFERRDRDEQEIATLSHTKTMPIGC